MDEAQQCVEREDTVFVGHSGLVEDSVTPAEMLSLMIPRQFPLILLPGTPSIL